MYYKTSIDNIYKFFTKGKGVENTKRYLEKHNTDFNHLPEDIEGFILGKVVGFLKKVRKKKFKI
jgi:hypothetical protein